MSQNYIGLIRKEPDSDYGVSFPDFPGVVTAGTDLDDARRMAEEALALHVEGMIEDGDPLPSPLTLEAVMADGDNSDAVAFLVPVAVPSRRAVRLNITLPENVVKDIDRYAGSRGMTRSAFLLKASVRAMAEDTERA
ncbi:Predicted nuclease of the RNAse H fold, HicB family [Rhizobium sp. RU20A]|uniref:type II toxin-antitoxin system HicB family antitoxin n=1 Tax=Rhizobium sp. RU20A TaxID=1907412 RepID=UPI0009565DCA|nr:type II toxin-antitoxin system HicB family antitoxin [Rhizobium sp. RU20A]SIR10193.1 Predicted nuclease of the RNAse H fold, HicB family [Rhizobium sp. RU20A]